MKERKLFIVVLLLITTNLIFGQHEYKIVYADGIADMVVHAGDTIKHNISFTMDSLERKDLEGGIVMFSAYGSSFFAKKFRVVETIEENVVTLFDIVIVDDPSMLLANNSVSTCQDYRTLGDSRDDDIGMPYYYFFALGIIFILFMFIIKMKF